MKESNNLLSVFYILTIQRRRSWTHSQSQYLNKKKYWGIILIKQVKDLKNKKLKLLQKEIKTVENGKTQCSWIGRINTSEGTHLNKSCRFDVIPITMLILHINRKTSQYSFEWKPKYPELSWVKHSNAGVITTQILKYVTGPEYKKQMYYQYKNRKEQTQRLNFSTPNFSHFISDKDAKTN